MNLTKPPHMREAFKKVQSTYNVDIETGRTCNLQCVYCFASSGKALDNELSTNEIYNIVDQCFDLDVKFIDLIGGGEPFLNNDIMAIVKYIVNKGGIIGIFTNGTRLSQRICDELFNLPCYIVTHFNSFDKNIEDYLSGLKGSSEMMRRGLNYLIQAGFAKKGRLGLHTLINEYNIKECEKIYSWERENNIIPCMQLPVIVGRMPLKLQVPPIQTQELFYKLAEIDKIRYGYEWVPVPPYVSYSCDYRKKGIYVDSIGNIKLCNSTNYIFGNVRKQSLSEILDDKTMIAARNLKNLKGYCSNCSYLGELCFGGCMAQAYAMTGDLLESDYRCWHNLSCNKL